MGVLTLYIRRVGGLKDSSEALMESKSKSDRLNLRVTPEQRRLFQEAADLEKTNLTAFILDAARIRAEQRLADQDQFALPPGRLRAFMKALDRPPRKIPRLHRLMRESSALERETDAPRTDAPRRDTSTDEV